MLMPQNARAASAAASNSSIFLPRFLLCAFRCAAVRGFGVAAADFGAIGDAGAGPCPWAETKEKTSNKQATLRKVTNERDIRRIIFQQRPCGQSLSRIVERFR